MIDGMFYAPRSEQEVLFLFGRLAPRLGFQVKEVTTRFPDCKASRHGKDCTIEFELWASNYELHRHAHKPPKAANYIVCWENDWETPPPKYRHIEVIDLKKYVEAPSRIFVIASNPDNARWLKHDSIEWNVPNAAQIGDLVLMYRSKQPKHIRDLWKIVGPFTHYDDKSTNWPGRQAGLSVITRLREPLTLEALRHDPTTRDLPIVRADFVAKTDITAYWWKFYDKIVKLNPSKQAALRDYRPE